MSLVERIHDEEACHRVQQEMYTGDVSIKLDYNLNALPVILDAFPVME